MSDRLTSDDYKRAIAIQDACNLSGVVHSFSVVMSRIWSEARRLKLGTDWVNVHPICVLYSSKISSLTNSDNANTFSEAYNECLSRSLTSNEYE